MKAFLVLTATLLLAAPAFAEENLADLANRAKFNQACKAMLSDGGACYRVPIGGGGRRRCVNEHISDPKVTPECRAVISEWKALKK